MARAKRDGEQLRRAQLAKIHIAARQLGLDEEAYRAALYAVARVRSARDLDEAGRRRVLDHFRACGWRDQHAGQHRRARPRNFDSPERARQLRKIEALLADAGRPWAYVEAMVSRICKVERIEFCGASELRSLIAALSKDQQRRARRQDGASA